MGKLIRDDEADGRLHIESPLMGESLVKSELLRNTNRRGIPHARRQRLKNRRQSICGGRQGRCHPRRLLLTPGNPTRWTLMTGRRQPGARHIIIISA